MKVALFDFQKEALHQLREKVEASRQSASPSNPQAVVFSAPTGSGKTIMATSLFEAILDGPDEQLDWPSSWAPDRRSVILWLSYSPDLNEQTRMKMEAKSDRIYRVNQLITIDSEFDAEKLEGGAVYFLNLQKIGTGQPLTKKDDGRSYTIWETLANTVRHQPSSFLVVIDEAHQGMGGSSPRTATSAAEATSLMQRFLLGHADVGLPKMPIVIGISATPQRFTNLVVGAGAGHTIHSVAIPPSKVRDSGLLKDRVLIHHPKSAQSAELTLLEEAARQWSTLATSWEEYCFRENESRVWPILVMQVENGAGGAVTRTNLAQALRVLERSIGRRLLEGEVVHAINDASDLDVDGILVRRVEASRIEGDRQIGVVLFKTALSTGWDCPRAEVMMSFRSAQDSTYVAQLLGRMVRTPLARRIHGDASLNDVHLFVPHFDKKTVKSVVAALEDAESVPPTETGSSDELVVLERAPSASELFPHLGSVPTYRVNAVRAQSNLRRLVGLARTLTKDDVSEHAWQETERTVISWLDEHLNRMSSDGSFETAAAGLRTLSVETQVAVNGALSETQHYGLLASSDDIDRVFEEAGRRLGNGLHMVYWRAHADRDPLEVKVVIAVLSSDERTMLEVDARSGAAFDELYDLHKLAIGRLTESRRLVYDKLRLAAPTPQPVAWELPASIAFRRTEHAYEWEKHLYVEAGGKLRADLREWEEEVIRAELTSAATVGWLRNMDRKPWALELPYRKGGEVRPMFPDFVVIEKREAGYVVHVLEPHDPSLADNVEKAVGMAEYCEKHGDKIGRMELIRKVGSTFKRLDMNRSIVQAKAKLLTTNAQLNALFTELGTV